MCIQIEKEIRFLQGFHYLRKIMERHEPKRSPTFANKRQTISFYQSVRSKCLFTPPWTTHLASCFEIISSSPAATSFWSFAQILAASQTARMAWRSNLSIASTISSFCWCTLCLRGCFTPLPISHFKTYITTNNIDQVPTMLQQKVSLVESYGFFSWNQGFLYWFLCSRYKFPGILKDHMQAVRLDSDPFLGSLYIN